MLAAWSLRAQGVPVKYLVCDAGMRQCVLGATLAHPLGPPPCKQCVRFSERLFPAGLTIPLQGNDNVSETIHEQLMSLSLDELLEWEYDGLKLGRLCQPSLQWALRRTDLEQDENSAALLTSFIASAAGLIEGFNRTLDELEPRTIVIFNGMFYPEAVLRAVAQRCGVRVLTHEVGLQPFSVFISDKLATFRQVNLPKDFKLSPEMSSRLDRYLKDRFTGRFSMAGVEFWPVMDRLPEDITLAMKQHRQTVVVFSNVIFDTSQAHANSIFPDMFAWLSDLGQIIAQNPETLFILRAHPDEDRPGKTSRQSVAGWLESRDLLGRENFRFLSPSQYVSSYELIQHAKFVMVYNSSIGIEATIKGVPVLMAGQARFTHEPTAHIPKDMYEYHILLEAFLSDAGPAVPPEMLSTARRLLYLELYHASLDLSRFLQPDPVLPGMVTYTDFTPDLIQTDEVLAVIRDGIVKEQPFLLPLG